MKTFRDLVVWQKSFDLCVEIYRATRTFPKEETYGLVGQLRRAAVSIPSNIAEGFGRRTTADFIRSLHFAYGSVCELDTQLELAGKLDYLRGPAAASLRGALGDVERLCSALMRSLARKRSATRPLDHATTGPLS